ncbi:MAG: hypothetical protein CMO26_22050 [Thiotrichales bacterium]|nr:hypothetical protein [Thiotrichales bacterium]
MNIIAAGDCAIDRYVNLRVDRPGGISLNFAVNARQHFAAKAQIGVLGAIGTDAHATLVLDTLVEHRIRNHLHVAEGRSPVQLIDQEPDGEKVFLQFDAGVLGEHRITAPQRKVLEQADVLMMTVYRHILGFFASVITAPSRGVRAVDFGAFTPLAELPAFIQRYAAHFHIGFFSFARDETRLLDELQSCAHRHDCVFVATHGAAGASVITPTDQLSAPAAPTTEVRDTTGAGDTLAAAFLAQYMLNRDLEASLEAGLVAAAQAVSRLGAFDAVLVPWPGDSGDGR